MHGMAYNISKINEGKYLVTDNLEIIRQLVEFSKDETKLKKFIDGYIESMKDKFQEYFRNRYQSNWNNYFNQRST